MSRTTTLTLAAGILTAALAGATPAQATQNPIPETVTQADLEQSRADLAEAKAQLATVQGELKAKLSQHNCPVYPSGSHGGFNWVEGLPYEGASGVVGTVGDDEVRTEYINNRSVIGFIKGFQIPGGISGTNKYIAATCPNPATPSDATTTTASGAQATMAQSAQTTAGPASTATPTALPAASVLALAATGGILVARRRTTADR